METVNRFSSKVDLYVRYRWEYHPQACIEILEKTHLSSEGKIADVGSGPGSIAQHFLNKVAQVYAIEPNAQMRAKAAFLLGDHGNLTLIDAYADRIPLSDKSVDLITVGRAIHWFSPDTTATEFRRILVPNGWLAILKVSCSDKDILKETEILKTEAYGWDPEPSPGDKYDNLISFYLGHENITILRFLHTQQETFSQFLGRSLSKSRCPNPGDPMYPRFEAKAHEIFNQFAQNGILNLNLVTEVKLGQINHPGNSNQV